MMTALLLLAQELYPIEDHPWLRYAAGTWIKYAVSVDTRDGKRESESLRTLKARDDGSFTVTTDYGAGSPVETEVGDRPRKTGTETIQVMGKDVECIVWTAKGKTNDVPGVATFWGPAGSKAPYKLRMKEAERTVEMVVEALDAKIELKGKTYLCHKLKGTIRTPQGETAIATWLNPGVPAGQLRLELMQPTPEGPVKIVMTAVDVEERR